MTHFGYKKCGEIDQIDVTPDGYVEVSRANTHDMTPSEITSTYLT
jgi:hypothetical protein